MADAERKTPFLVHNRTPIESDYSEVRFAMRGSSPST